MPVKALYFESVDLVKMQSNKIKRCLFGKPDHEKLRRDLDEQLKEAYEDIRSTWNFDAELDLPIEGGRWKWDAVKADAVPSVYTKQYRPTKFARRRLERECTTDTERSSQTPPSSPLPEFSLLESRLTDNVSDAVEDIRRENETTPEPRPASQRQSRMDEFMKVKKRKISDEDLDVGRPSKSSRSRRS